MPNFVCFLFFVIHSELECHEYCAGLQHTRYRYQAVGRMLGEEQVIKAYMFHF